MPKKTYKDICEKHGITRGMMDAAKADGVNCRNDSDLAEWLKGRRHRIKPDAKIPVGDKAAHAESLEEIEAAIRKSSDIDTIKILKAKLDALKVAVAIRKEMRELIDIGEVRQAGTRAASAARGELLKLSSDLPPRLAGLSEAKMQPVIRAEVVEILGRLADATSSIYDEPAN